MTGNELRAWRRKQGLTQEQLANCLGVIRVTIARWETDVRAVPSFLPLALEALEYRMKQGGRDGLIQGMSLG
jgi:transcriptional regulator with XRE-family HTH domain